MTDLKKISIKTVSSHPDNPRVALREDVINSIVANLDGEFPKKHAIHVRKIDAGYQILSGHTRTEAARRKGLTEVWAWVDDLDDQAAFMELVTSNSQGELSPLEIGIHALKAVPKEQGKKGGGLKDYAERIGKTGEYIGQLRQAAEVLTSTSKLEFGGFLDKAKHLCAIHKLPRPCWPAACEWLASSEASVADVEQRVAVALAFRKDFDPSADWKDYLPVDACTAAVIGGKSASVFARLLSLANDFPEKVAKLAKAHPKKAAAFKAVGETWKAWLIDNTGKDSWDDRKVRAKRDELDEQLWEIEQAATQSDLVTIIAADFRKAKIEANTFDVIITDPPYPEEFLPLYGDLGSFALRTLKPGGSLFVMCGQSYLPRVLALLCESLAYNWTLAYLTPGGQAVQCWDRKAMTFWKPVIWLTKGKHSGEWIGDVCKSEVNDNDKDHHHWGQSESGMADLIERATRVGQHVCDPFMGGGTTGVVCSRLKRVFTGIEIDKKVAETSRLRIIKELGNV